MAGIEAHGSANPENSSESLAGAWRRMNSIIALLFKQLTLLPSCGTARSQRERIEIPIILMLFFLQRKKKRKEAWEKPITFVFYLSL
jgi:hypothetical protein